jgi:DNA-binding transcriptional ArsR family regulator
MKHGPDIARVAALMGDPARANMLTALLDGRALTASELAAEAGVTKQTASGHLAKLLEAEFVVATKQGRHRYFRLADHEIAELLENLSGIAARHNPLRVRTGPKEPALRRARVCYDHLAGERGVQLFEALARAGWIVVDGEQISVSRTGLDRFADFGIDIAALKTKRRPLCRTCLDWSVRRSHLAGSLGAAMLDRFYELKWARRIAKSRVVEFSPAGEQALTRLTQELSWG